MNVTQIFVRLMTQGVSTLTVQQDDLITISDSAIVLSSRVSHMQLGSSLSTQQGTSKISLRVQVEILIKLELEVVVVMLAITRGLTVNCSLLLFLSPIGYWRPTGSSMCQLNHLK